MDYRRSFGLCACAMVFATVTYAEDSGAYVGVSVGEAAQSSGEFSGSDFSYRLLAGWSFKKYFAVEGGYTNAGEQRDHLGPVNVAVSSDGFFVAALGKFPIGDVVAPFVKIGYGFYDSKQTLSAGSTRMSRSESADDLLFGGGLEFRFGDKVRLRAEYEKVDVPDANFAIYSIVGTYHF